MKTITLEKEVMVSDPCYSEPTWCQVKLKTVKPGEYYTFCKVHDSGEWGKRNSMLLVIHKDYIDTKLDWNQHKGEVGVDSGQAGIFSYSTYRKDGLEMEVPTTGYDGNNFDWLDKIHKDDVEGDDWYVKMCKLTLTEQGYGSYSNGTVCRSGYGDGGYPLFVAKKGRQIVAIAVDFLVEDSPYFEFNWYKEMIEQ
jgi:hypothetical protein